MTVNRNEFDQDISGQVRAEIARASVSKKWVAERIGMHVNVLRRKCRGDVAFTAGELNRVAHALGTTAKEITAQAERRFYNNLNKKSS